jgi:hypothetical protein
MLASRVVVKLGGFVLACITTEKRCSGDEAYKPSHKALQIIGNQVKATQDFLLEVSPSSYAAAETTTDTLTHTFQNSSREAKGLSH